MEVIIAACKQPETLANCLDCIEHADHTGIFVGDAGGYCKDVCYRADVYWKACPMDGFAANVNRLLDHCTDAYALLLGADVYVPICAIRKLQEHATPDTIVCGVTVNTGSSRNNWHKSRVGPTKVFSGNFSLIPLGFLRAHNIRMREEYFSYGADTAFGLDWLSAGGKMLCVPSAVAIHDHWGYYNTHATKDKYYYLTRNLLHLARQYPEARSIAYKIVLGLIILKPQYAVFQGLLHYIKRVYGKRP